MAQGRPDTTNQQRYEVPSSMPKQLEEMQECREAEYIGKIIAATNEGL